MSQRYAFMFVVAIVAFLAAGRPAAGAETFALDVTRDPADGGAFHVDPDLNSYESGTTVTVYAIPFPGFEFVGWRGDIEADESPLTFPMTADTALTAVFEPADPANQTFQVWVFSEPQDSGWVQWEGVKVAYQSGDEVVLTAVPAPGFIFAGWTGDVPAGADPADPDLRLVVEDHLTLAANFQVGAAIAPGRSAGSGSVGCGALGMIGWPLLILGAIWRKVA